MIFSILGWYVYVDKPRFPENWIGMWKKEGHTARFSQSQSIMKCSYCVEDAKFRAARQPVQMIRSYRVAGCMKPESTWEWWEGVCENPNRCWGLKNRFWTVLRSSSGQWVFRTQTSELDDPQQLSNIDELRVTLQQTEHDRLLYSGIASGRHCNSFWPLIKSRSKSPYRKIIIKMRSGEPMPINPSLMQQLGTLRKSLHLTIANII